MTQVRDRECPIGIRFTLEFNVIFIDCRLLEIAVSRAITKLAGGGFDRSRQASGSAIVWAHDLVFDALAFFNHCLTLSRTAAFDPIRTVDFPSYTYCRSRSEYALPISIL